VQIEGERISITEKMFKASESTPGFSGIHHMIVESISKSDIDIRRDLFLNIIVAGGNTLFKGFVDRLQNAIPEISPQNIKARVISTSDRKFSPWVGGSILSSLGSFQQMWMSRQEYQEHGAIMIERKCP
jgi:actin-related protein